MGFFEKSRTRQKKVTMRRSRPYKKNDQCYVEQKNYTHVRNLFAYDRLDEESHAVGCRERDKQGEGRGSQQVQGSGVHSFRLKELKILESFALFWLGSY